jgi:hypothetical protein
MPDGEVGDRRYWIDGIAYRVFNGHPEIETLRRPAPDANGVESWRPLEVHDQFQFRVKPGGAQVRFGDPGWRLGYTKDAVGSHFVFRQLQKEGVIPLGVRLQVCLPLTFSAIGLFFSDPDDHAKVAPALTAAFRAEIAKTVELIPAQELAIQWDLAVENRLVDAALAREGTPVAEALAARLVAPAAEIASAIPESVALGYHGCFGTLSGWPSRQPLISAAALSCLMRRWRLRAAASISCICRRSALRTMRFSRRSNDCGRRTQRFISAPSTICTMPTACAVSCKRRGGISRNSASRRRAVSVARAPCGFGRAPERRGRLLTSEGGVPPTDILDIIVRDHLNAVELLHEAGG